MGSMHRLNVAYNRKYEAAAAKETLITAARKKKKKRRNGAQQKKENIAKKDLRTHGNDNAIVSRKLARTASHSNCSASIGTVARSCAPIGDHGDVMSCAAPVAAASAQECPAASRCAQTRTRRGVAVRRFRTRFPALASRRRERHRRTARAARH